MIVKNLSGIISIIQYMLGQVSKNRVDELSHQIKQIIAECSEEVKQIITTCSGIDCEKM